jgi:hypothetical protein
MGFVWGDSPAGRRDISGRRPAPPRAGFLARAVAVLARPSAELGQDRHIASDGRAPHLAALERITRRTSA